MGEQVSSWYTDNKQVAIPVTVVVGLVILAILFWIARCIFCSGGVCCCGGKRRKPTKKSNLPRPDSSSSTAPMRQNAATGYVPSSGGGGGGQDTYAYGSSGQAGVGAGSNFDYGNQYYNNGGYNGYAAAPSPPEYAPPSHPPPAAAQMSRQHFVDDRMYNGQNYRGY